MSQEQNQSDHQKQQQQQEQQQQQQQQEVTDEWEAAKSATLAQQNEKPAQRHGRWSWMWRGWRRR